MDIAAILTLISEGTKAFQTAREVYGQIKDTLSETDQKNIEQALATAREETVILRHQVNAALSKASKS